MANYKKIFKTWENSLGVRKFYHSEKQVPSHKVIDIDHLLLRWSLMIAHGFYSNNVLSYGVLCDKGIKCYVTLGNKGNMEFRKVTFA